MTFKKQICKSLVLILSLIIFVSIAKPASFKSYYVFQIPTKSMLPAIKPSSIVLVKSDSDYNTGDVIAYKNIINKVIIHRIININNGVLTTKGDNNDFEDKLIYQNKVLGKVVRVFSLQQIIFYSCLFCFLLVIGFYVYKILFGRKDI